MPSNIFATTGTNVSVIFLEKGRKRDDVLLMDASRLGTSIKEGKNQKTLLSPEEEDLIIQTFNSHVSLENFSVLVNYETLKEKNYSFSAGQYFEIKSDYIDISTADFNQQLSFSKLEIEKLFEQSNSLTQLIKSQIDKLKYEQ